MRECVVVCKCVRICSYSSPGESRAVGILFFYQAGVQVGRRVGTCVCGCVGVWMCGCVGV